MEDFEEVKEPAPLSCRGCIFNINEDHCTHPIRKTEDHIGCGVNRTIFPFSAKNISIMAKLKLGVK